MERTGRESGRRRRRGYGSEKGAEEDENSEISPSLIKALVWHPEQVWPTC